MAEEKNMNDGSVEFTDSEQAPPRENPSKESVESLKEIEEGIKQFKEAMAGFSAMGDNMQDTMKEVTDLLAEVEPLIKLYSK